MSTAFILAVGAYNLIGALGLLYPASAWERVAFGMSALIGVGVMFVV